MPRGLAVADVRNWRVEQVIDALALGPREQLVVRAGNRGAGALCRLDNALGRLVEEGSPL